MSLVLYYAPMSSSFTSQWVLEELGVPYEKVRIHLELRDQDKPGYRALNPNGKVPLLVHDGVPVFESAAITLHLGETFGVEKKLYPAPGLERAVATKWIVWAAVSLHAAVMRWYFASSDRVPAEQHNAKAAERAKAEVHELLGILDASLTGKTYVLGETLSLVDVHLASWASYIGMCGFDLAPHATLSTWLERVKSRPSLQRVLATETSAAA